MPQLSLYALLAVTALVHEAVALKQQVLSSFIYTRHGDRTPLYDGDSTTSAILTPYGATQMYNSGSKFRDRYLRTTFNDAADSTVIRDISHYQLNNDEVTVLTTADQFTIASAQAFMQGLYPPLAEDADQNHTHVAGISDLANGTNVVAPLNGYQYAEVNSASSYDLNSIWVDGAGNCPMYTAKLLEYYDSPDFDFLNKSTWEFYQALEDSYLQGSYLPKSFGYSGAYQMYDYLQYKYIHDASFRNSISTVNITRAKALAATYVYALYSNATDSVKSVAGKTLASKVLNTFYTAIQLQGQTNKLNLLFGDFEPMASFAALAGLTSARNSIFYNIPPMASSFVFELVALVPDDDTGASFPSDSDLFVQFYYQNGTDEDSSLVSYALFGRSPSLELIPYGEFVNGLEKFALNGVEEWCNICGAYTVFCDSLPVTGRSSSRSGSKLSPAVAGVIGALVALVVAGILFGLLMLLAGFRVHRQPGKRKSELSGFKGSQKLASDQDLTIPKGVAVASVTEPEAAKGHERIGSWELRNQAKEQQIGSMGAVNTSHPRRPSFEDDEIHVNPFAAGVKPHDHV